MADFVGTLYFQTEKVARSLGSKGNIYAIVDPITSGFKEFVGTEKVAVEVPVHNARGNKMTLDDNGFELIEHEMPSGIDFYNEEQILSKYYEEVARIVKEKTGAFKVYSFDHVVRNTDVSEKYSLKKGQKIGGPALMVHGDYAMLGAPARLANFLLPPKNDDAFRPAYGDRPLISEEEMQELRGRRYAFINLWRSFSELPCVDMPLTLCDATTTAKEDWITIEFRYVDCTIETYLGGHSSQQKWYYFPEVTKDEGILLKTYDSQGALWKEDSPESYTPYHKDEPAIPATCVLHTAVKDPRVTPDMPKRESIEVRTIVFF